MGAASDQCFVYYVYSIYIKHSVLQTATIERGANSLLFFFFFLQNVDGVNYFHVKVVGLLFVATSRTNLSPSLVLELLQRISRVIKDYLGVLNEDSLRKNFVLVYELLDEVVVSHVLCIFHDHL